MPCARAPLSKTPTKICDATHGFVSAQPTRNVKWHCWTVAAGAAGPDGSEDGIVTEGRAAPNGRHVVGQGDVWAWIDAGDEVDACDLKYAE